MTPVALVADPPELAVLHRNEVNLTGRLSAAPEPRELPSGDIVMTWRLVVDRPEGSPGQTFDVIDCSAWTARLRRAANAWERGDVLEVTGSLRRRFWRAGGSLQSRAEVEVATASRVATAAGKVTRRRKRE